jgi:hypothetical protein
MNLRLQTLRDPSQAISSRKDGQHHIEEFVEYINENVLQENKHNQTSGHGDLHEQIDEKEA